MVSMATSRANGTKASRSNVASSAIKQMSWHSVKHHAVILISGPQELLATRAYSHLRNTLRDKYHDLETFDLDAAQYVGGALFDAASPSLFGEPRLIRVTSVEKCNDEFLTDILKYLDSPETDVTLVLRHSGGVRGKKILDTVRSGAIDAVEVACAEIKSDSEKVEFVTAEFVRADRKATPQAVRSLVNAFASDVDELASACLQLIQDVDGTITEQLVDDYYGGRVEATGFAVADAAIEGRLSHALVTLRHAVETGVDPVPLVAAFSAKLRLMAKVAGDRRSPQELASVVGAAPWQIDRARRDLSQWNESGLGNAIVAVAAADAGVKGASRDPIYALEKMVRIVGQFGLGE